MLQVPQPVAKIAGMNIPTWLRGVMEVRGYSGVRHATRELNAELDRLGVPEFDDRGRPQRFDISQISRWLTGDTSPSLPSCDLLSLATGHPYRDIAIMARLGDRDVRTRRNGEGLNPLGT